MDISTTLKENLHNVHSIVTGSKMERRAMPTVKVPTIHSVRIAELLKKTDGTSVLISKASTKETRHRIISTDRQGMEGIQ